MDDVVPGLAVGLDHEGDDEGVVGIFLLNFLDFAEVVFDGAVADELDVAEAHDAAASEVYGGVARGGVADLRADGLPDGSAPACVKGAHDLSGGVGGRAGREPEGVRRANAGEGYGEVGILGLGHTVLLVPHSSKGA